MRNLRMTACVLAACLGGCAVQNPGIRTFADEGSTRVENGLNSLSFSGGSASIATAAQGGWVTVGADGIDSLSVGGSTQQLLWDPQSRKFAISGGTDLIADEVVIEGDAVRFRGLRAVASDPTRAGGDALALAIPYLVARDQAQRDVVISQLEAARDAGSAAATAALQIIQRLSLPVP